MNEIVAALGGRGLICLLLGLYELILFIRVLLSWFPRIPEGLRPIVAFIFAATEPVVRIFRPLVPPIRIGAVALDVSIILLFFVLGLIRLGLGCGPFFIF